MTLIICEGLIEIEKKETLTEQFALVIAQNR